ncbi:hypothetical protein GQ53DRAFT_805827 [Thozetella sp. PMI_491]|nr:hypothetical protein GQ53DRAFT_805827 [Thozetella sp. PMI_491]
MAGAFWSWIEPLTCPLGALAFYLMACWDLSPEPFPCFASRSKCPHPDYQGYAEQLRSAGLDESMALSQLTLLEDAVPELSSFLHSLEARIQTTSERLMTQLRAGGQPAHGQPARGQPDIDPAHTIQAIPSQLAEVSRDPPRYYMSRTVSTVEGLWNEWMVGLPGQPSISSLDQQWGNRWRAKNQAEIQWYSLRKEVILEIQRTAQTRRIGMEAAVHTVAMDQAKTASSMDRFCKQLRDCRRIRMGGMGARGQVAVA